MIAVMFPTRTRKQIKAKWTKEDKLNPKKITAALYNPKKIGAAFSSTFPVTSQLTALPPQTSSHTPK